MPDPRLYPKPKAEVDDPSQWMVEFVLKSGRRHAFPWVLVNAIAFDPDDGLTVHFSGSSVSIRGTGLLPLYLALMRRETRSIAESSEPSGFVESDTSTHIDAISVSEPDADT